MREGGAAKTALAQLGHGMQEGAGATTVRRGNEIPSSELCLDLKAEQSEMGKKGKTIVEEGVGGQEEAGSVTLTTASTEATLMRRHTW